MRSALDSPSAAAETVATMRARTKRTTVDFMLAGWWVRRQQGWRRVACPEGGSRGREQGQDKEGEDERKGGYKRARGVKNLRLHAECGRDGCDGREPARLH